MKVNYKKRYDVNGCICDQTVTLTLDEVIAFNNAIRETMINTTDTYTRDHLRQLNSNQLMGEQCLKLEQVRTLQYLTGNKRLLARNTLLKIV